MENTEEEFISAEEIQEVFGIGITKGSKNKARKIKQLENVIEIMIGIGMLLSGRIDQKGISFRRNLEMFPSMWPRKKLEDALKKQFEITDTFFKK